MKIVAITLEPELVEAVDRTTVGTDAVGVHAHHAA